MNNKLKILLVSPCSVFFSGASYAFKNFVESIDTDSFEVYVVVGGKDELYYSLKSSNIKVFSINQYSVFWYSGKCEPLFSKNTIKYIIRYFMWFYAFVKISIVFKKFLKQHPVDCIYFDTFSIGFGSFVAHKMKLPVVWNARESINKQFNAKFLHPILQKNIINKANHACFISESVKSDYEDWLKSPKLSVVYDEVDPSFFCERNIFQNSTVYIAVFGRIAHDKGILQLVQGIEPLIKSGYPIKFDIFGEIESKHLLSTILKYIKQNELDENVFYNGYCENVKSELRNYDIVLNNSLYEGFGLAAFEAMLAGALLITNPNGSMGELLTDKKTAYFFDRKDNNKEKSLTKVLLECITNIQDSRIVAKNGQKYALNFTKGHGHKKMAQIIADTCKNSK